MAQKWPRVSAQWIHPPLAAFLNYISQLLLFWELKEIKSHTDHIYSAPILSKCTVLVWWLHIHLFPKSRDSRLAEAGLAEHSTEFCWGCQVRTELNLLSQLNECQLAYSGCKKQGGQEPNKTIWSKKSVLFFLPEFSRCHQRQRRNSQIRGNSTPTFLSTGQPTQKIYNQMLHSAPTQVFCLSWSLIPSKLLLVTTDKRPRREGRKMGKG